MHGFALRLAALCGALALVGCQVTHSLVDARPDLSTPPLPALYVVTTGNVEGFEIRNLMRASGVFQRVEEGQAPEGGYTVQIAAQTSQTKEKEGQMRASGTLTLLRENEQTLDNSLDFNVMQDDRTLRSYHYQNHSEYRQLFSPPPYRVKERNLRIIVNNFITDLQRDKVLQTPH